MKKIPNLSKKALVISLIKDDLIHLRLVYGLDAMQLNADDYMLHLCETIFSLMGIKEKHQQIDEILENYIYMTRKVKRINVLRSHAKVDRLAHEIYGYLRVVGR